MLFENVVFVAEVVTEALTENDKTEMKKKIVLLDKNLEKSEILAVLDLKLILRELATNGDTVDETEIQPKGKVRVTVEIPESLLRGFENVELIHFKDDGATEKITFIRNGNKITFETDSFSNFSFVGSNSQSTPQTGDTSNMALWIVLLFASAGVIGVLTFKRKKVR